MEGILDAALQKWEAEKAAEAAAPPAKRGRGRPRKNGTLPPVVTDPQLPADSPAVDFGPRALKHQQRIARIWPEDVVNPPRPPTQRELEDEEAYYEQQAQAALQASTAQPPWMNYLVAFSVAMILLVLVGFGWTFYQKFGKGEEGAAVLARGIPAQPAPAPEQAPPPSDAPPPQADQAQAFAQVPAVTGPAPGGAAPPPAPQAEVPAPPAAQEPASWTDYPPEHYNQTIASAEVPNMPESGAGVEAPPQEPAPAPEQPAPAEEPPASIGGGPAEAPAADASNRYTGVTAPPFNPGEAPAPAPQQGPPSAGESAAVNYTGVTAAPFLPGQAPAAQEVQGPPAPGPCPGGVPWTGITRPPFAPGCAPH